MKYSHCQVKVPEWVLERLRSWVCTPNSAPAAAPWPCSTRVPKSKIWCKHIVKRKLLVCIFVGEKIAKYMQERWMNTLHAPVHRWSPPGPCIHRTIRSLPAELCVLPPLRLWNPWPHWQGCSVRPVWYPVRKIKDALIKCSLRCVPTIRLPCLTFCRSSR